jgi:integrase/recombinase XerD
VLIYDHYMPADYLEGFTFRMRRNGLAESTVAKYEAGAADFLDWLDGEPIKASRADVERYLDQWAARSDAKPGTVRLRITAISKLYDYLDSQGLLVDEAGRELRNPVDRVERPKSRRKANDHLSAEETRALLAACVTPQEAALVDLLRWSGLRISEACALTWADYGGRALRVRESKTQSGIRSIPVLPELEKGLDSWRAHLESKGLYRHDGPILVSRNGTPMFPQFAWRLLKRVADRAGVRAQGATDATGHNVSTISPHTLRRTFATDLLNRGVRIETVSHALGHADTRTTQAHYAELASETARTEILSAYNVAASS